MYKLVLIRHGESTWNLENRFTGWTDVELTPTGVSQAMSAGKLLKAEGYEFDVAYTSVLKRAIHTLWLTLDEMGRIQSDPSPLRARDAVQLLEARKKPGPARRERQAKSLRQAEAPGRGMGGG